MALLQGPAGAEGTAGERGDVVSAPQVKILLLMEKRVKPSLLQSNVHLSIFSSQGDEGELGEKGSVCF